MESPRDDVAFTYPFPKFYWHLPLADVGAGLWVTQHLADKMRREQSAEHVKRGQMNLLAAKL